MAAPTTTTVVDPDTLITATGTNSDVDTYLYSVQRGNGRLTAGFSIYTGTLSNCTIKILLKNVKTETSYDATMEFFGVPALVANTMYQVLVPVPVGLVILSAQLTNATNAVNFSFFVPKGRN